MYKQLNSYSITNQWGYNTHTCSVQFNDNDNDELYELKKNNLFPLL